MRTNKASEARNPDETRESGEARQLGEANKQRKTRNLGATLSALALPTLVGIVAGTVPAAAAPTAPTGKPSFCHHDHRHTPNSRYLCARAGDLLKIRIGDVHPTQTSVGYDEIYYKLGRYTLGKDKVNKRFDDWCEANGQGGAAAARPDARLSDPSTFTCEIPKGQENDDSLAEMKTVVIGPGGTPYLTDGHHTLTAFDEIAGPDVTIRVRVQANLSTLPRRRFWSEMERHHWVWLRDANGDPVGVNKLPTHLGLRDMTDDRLRGLVYFAKGIGYDSPTATYAKFHWANWLRGSSAEVDLSTWKRDDFASYLDTVRQVSRAQSALSPQAVVDGGATASDLGALKEWNEGKAAGKGAFGKLSRLYGDDKPGKLAYAIEYRKVHGIAD
ncbi:ParB/Srx family N-terminal domain-containing protein [Streptomyces beihaiensis]|uniref:ParB/Srx family N-terminal domain-containing protein n=1 Tax=Streptomyces beihaiensis TaxID=2984495 RepID=A0ABT3TXK1_9ACTN|nr:ParB/Srx family N-terminal domain-containing protein [Streptomyces beihaiensis]MCX3061761.1 ParB/Srx family N-terminal domain-containing protein [Streptomyces beihaiensis]